MAGFRKLELGYGDVYFPVASRECAEQFEKQYELHVGIPGRDFEMKKC